MTQIRPAWTDLHINDAMKAIFTATETKIEPTEEKLEKNFGAQEGTRTPTVLPAST